MAKPKITIFQCTLIYTGGGERIVLGQIDGLQKRGYKVECFAPVLDKKSCYPDMINQYPLYSLLPQLPEWFPFRYALMLLLTSVLAPFLAFRFRDTDLFIGENQPGTWLAFVISRILGKPYISFTCHPNKMVYPREISRKQIWKNQHDFYALSIFFEPFKTLLKFLDKLSFTGSQQPVLVNGSFIGWEFEQLYQTPWLSCPSGAPFVKEESKVIANNKVYQGEINIGKFKIKKPYLLYVGRHEVWKNIDLAIEAFKKTVDQDKEIRFVIYGPFINNTVCLKRLVKNLGLSDKVIFIKGGNNQEELKKLYFNALMLLFPSKKEDFGIVIIEAMGAGVPVVAWNYAGPTDIIIDGKTGFLAHPYDLEDFSQKILKIMQNQKLRHQMSLYSWRRVRDNFSWQRHIDILEEQIKKAVKKSP